MVASAVVAIVMMIRKSNFMIAGRLAVLLALAFMTFFIGACGITAPRNNDGFADLESLGFPG
jgi:hypothetical protein